MDWERLKLAETTEGGYAAASRPVADLVADAVKARQGTPMPTIAWILDEEDMKTNDQLEARVFCDEKIGLALKRFHCLRAEIDSVPDDRQAEALRRQAPIFYFFDPAGVQVREMHGKRATSRSGLCASIQKMWDLSYTKKLKDFSRAMGKILDRMDRLESEKNRISDKMARAADNPRKLAKLQKEEDVLTAEEAKVAEEEEEILKSVALRKEFLQGDESVQK